MPTNQSSKPLVALHLSDIHFGQERGEAVEINRDARDQVVVKVSEIAKARLAASKAPIGGIIVTGDIAYSGQKTQFDEAVLWLTELSDAAGSDRLSVQVVPGNHDVDRGKSFMLSSMMKELLAKGRELLDKVLGNPGDCTALYRRFDAYQEFANGYGCPLDINGGNAGMKRHTFAPGKNLNLLGLNSALLCSGEENAKTPQLLLGARQRIIKEAPDAEYAILVHHPMRWLEDGDDTWNYIDNRARVLMCGHEHKPNVEMRKTKSGREVLVIDAGATVPDEVTEEFTYTFNVIEMDLSADGKAIDVTVDTYKWLQDEVRFEQDTTNHEGGKPKAYNLPCPKFAEGDSAVPAPAPSPAPPIPAEAVSAGDDETDRDEPDALIEAIDIAAVPPDEVREVRSFAQARNDFFHNLSVQQRMAALVSLKALPPESDTTFSQNQMMRQLDRLNRAGRLPELTAAIALAQKDQ
nr:metallophosphoesterase [uncultured Sphingomonas sp.]